jgi:catabolite regulation protein CreA
MLLEIKELLLKGSSFFKQRIFLIFKTIKFFKIFAKN